MATEHQQSKLSTLIDERNAAITRAEKSERRLRFAEELIRESIRALEPAARSGCSYAHYALNDARVFLQNTPAVRPSGADEHRVQR